MSTGISFMLPRDKVHPEPFSKIGHDGAGHGYLGTSTINVENFSAAILLLSLCSLFESQDVFINILKMQIARSKSS